VRGRRTARGWPAAGLTAALLAAALLVLGAPATAAPARPTADPSAPTPTAPLTEAPPQGTAPDGSTVGGEGLDTRGIRTAIGARPLPGGIAATGWLVADVETGEVLGARDPHGRYYPASTLKTLTLLTLVPELDPRQIVVGTAEDEHIEGSRVGIVEGGRYRVQLLFQGLVMQSGNDAAHALARVFGGVRATVEAMNETAERIGAYDTVAGGPSGLDVAGQTSSAYDLALIFRALLENPRTAELLRTRTAQMPPVPGRSPGYQIQNENPLLTTYPGALGGKTGFTDAARHTYVGAARRGGRTLVVSVLNTESEPLRASEQAARLLDWGFTVPASAEPVGTLVRPADLTASPTPAPTPTPTPLPSSSAATPATAATPTVAAPSAAASSSPLVPAVLIAALAVVLAAALAGAGAVVTRRRSARRARAVGVAVPAAAVAPPGPPGSAPPTPAASPTAPAADPPTAPPSPPSEAAGEG
jgi:D-alanyl-D-alanine carboxypeptidase (penicillin-binding protein 5/6)